MIVYVTPHDIETCQRKRHFPSAAKARKILKRRGGKRNHAVEVYKCPVCLDYCLGGKHHKTVEELAVEEIINLWIISDAYNSTQAAII